MVPNSLSVSDNNRSWKTHHAIFPPQVSLVSLGALVHGTPNNEAVKFLQPFPSASPSIYSTTTTGFKARPISLEDRPGFAAPLDTPLEIFWRNTTASCVAEGNILAARSGNADSDLRDYIVLKGVRIFGFPVNSQLISGFILYGKLCVRSIDICLRGIDPCGQASASRSRWNGMRNPS